MEKQHDDKAERFEAREIEVDVAEAQGLEVIELERAPLTDLNFGF